MEKTRSSSFEELEILQNFLNWDDREPPRFSLEQGSSKSIVSQESDQGDLKDEKSRCHSARVENHQKLVLTGDNMSFAVTREMFERWELSLEQKFVKDEDLSQLKIDGNE